MSSHVSYQREESVASERTLDNLEAIPSNLPSPVHSPTTINKTSGQMSRNLGPGIRAGDSRPPHHGRASPIPLEQYDYDERDRETSRSLGTRVSWQSPNLATVQASSKDEKHTTSQFSFDYNDENVTGHSSHSSPERGSGEITRVVTGSDSSPIRRLKKKEDVRPVERELSDAYIDSISRTPRYTLGRHNTYDEMLGSMNTDDPFQGSYQPSGKTPREKSKIPRPPKSDERKENFFDEENLEKHYKKKSKKRKKKKDNELTNDTQGSYSYTNTAYQRSPVNLRPHESDHESVKSNGTYTLNNEKTKDIRSSITNMAGPILKKSPHKVMSMSTCHSDIQNCTDKELDNIQLANFVTQGGKFLQRICKVYVQDKKSAKNNCQCGRSVEWHEMNDIEVPDFHKHRYIEKNIWHHKTHTEVAPTDSFGVIQFQGFGQESYNSPYIRLCPTTEMENLWTLLTEHWKLPIPKLLISVTGGAQRFDLNPRLKAVFKRGLINAATTTGAWIITGGTATGVMQFVGEAVRDHLITLGSSENNIVALGIATWGCIANREALDGEGDEGIFPATYSLEDVSEVKGRDVPLDHNHTHFMLVDDGTEGKFGAEIEFRSTFERYVSEKVETGVAESQSVNVPVVMLVVEGGVNTMKTVWQAVQQNIPVLVLNGSGRAADFIAYGYLLSKDPKNEDKPKFPPDFNEEMTHVAQMKFAWKSTDNVKKKVAECLRQLRDALNTPKLINIFNLGEADTKDIDRAILYALLKANKTNANAQLSLALAWNRCDIARHEIFTQSNRQYWKNLPLYDAMFTALVQDRVDFVHLFMENGVSLKKFLSIETLWNLYANALLDTSDTMAQTLNNLILYLKQTWGAYLCCRPTNTSKSDPELLSMVGKLMVHLLGDENFNSYTDEKFVVKKPGKPELKWLPGNHDAKLNVKGQGLSKHQSDNRKSFLHPVSSTGSIVQFYENAASESGKRFFKRKRHEYDFKELAERELFLWAILFNRRELGKMMWRAGQDQLGAALVACAILKALAAVADDDEELELSQDLEDHANMYEDMAVGVISECYKRDKMMAHQLLVRRLEPYGKTTLFTLADTHTLMKFMGNTCCQTKLNLIWKGRMALYTQSWKILLSLVFPFCVPTIKFTTNEGLLPGSDQGNDDYDDLDEGEEVVETNKEDIRVISNKVMPNTVSREGPEEELFVRSKSRRANKKRKKLYRVQMFTDTRTNSIGLLDAFYFFYTAPVSVFIVNTISYLVFLALFTYFVLTNLYPDQGSMVEYVVWGWTITMLLEEIRQVLSNDKRSLWYKIRGWFGSMWNRFDLAMYMIFLLSVILRFTLPNDKFTYARIFYSITVAMYYLRFMQVFFVEKNIGPKVIMITNMVIDLMFFLGIFLFFLLSFGIMYQANLFPNSPASWYLLKSVLYIPYWQMYGELFLENLEGEHPSSCTTNESIWRPAGGVDRCPEENALVPLLGAVYLILTNILLVNLLIAMFSYTFQMVQDKSEQVWRFYRYSLVYEFYDRPKFCPPLIVISHVYRSILWIRRRTCSSKKYMNEFKLNLDAKDNNRLTLFVRSATENYLNISQKAEKEELGNKVADTANRIERVIEELDSIKEQVRLSRVTPIMDESRPGTAEPMLMDTSDTIVPLSSRKSSNMNARVELMQAQMSDLGDQVAQAAMKTDQMMAMMQQILSQQRVRQGTLEISEVNQ
ncbi:transient receptor potential cation channel subfamily M member 2-like isoform X4 [Ruditapes philippinarum]|uniref:transient receptor potential cation channel subfamily M member 2-like isoform X4 n=1 Tax=Ruditapes philippinarum TaxID=129788 RepID=UPI00295A8FC9|nr:transient receptor potential cation channel subfamily M member 2-like isoform X4 [Ruditapes philippinarum]